MPFTFYNPPTLSPEQVSPFGNLLKNALSKYMLLNQAQYQPKMLKEELLKNQLANKWFEPNIESLINSRKANLGLVPLRKALLEQSLTKIKNANDPMYEINSFKNLMDMVNSSSSGTKDLGLPNTEIGQGLGIFSPEGLQDVVKNNTVDINEHQKNNLDLLKQNPFVRGIFKKKFGFDPFSETPEQRRASEQEAKINLENIKTENKAKAIKDREFLAVQKDMPTLEKSLKGVNELLRIAQQNPDMFGHGFLPERFAKTTKIKDFGRWQNLISDAIAGLEQKLSSRGNIVALKMASQLKPSHAEQQPVAIGKLESMREQLIDTINNARKTLGKEKLTPERKIFTPKYKDSDIVIVEGPNGEETMTYAQAKKLGAK